jgi:hypothetical protein
MKEINPRLPRYLDPLRLTLISFIPFSYAAAAHRGRVTTLSKPFSRVLSITEAVRLSAMVGTERTDCRFRAPDTAKALQFSGGPLIAGYPLALKIQEIHRPGNRQV